ncbi:NAD(P)-dependent oxidoreductase [Pseudorhodobacter sp. MZDSW-24AT]|uniref:NAD(P)-dependent oxidoreductase n=1 Tax=Pseudorhodobacter sp. MZDSW-24AT TaxID=2052957 RepID=UPI000C1F621A|nr:NAD(P)-dependent oxidoreductase [Pseudorhodobacter sp. MZDSW-24AT]PJF08422.1 oxidoreductase [Pseudorhodobacter sp. MZDSW-24AT]
MSLTLGFVGIGRMGNPMTRRLLAAGHSVYIYDPSSAAMDALAEAGAHPAASPAEVASNAQIVLLSLPTPDIVKKVALGDGGLSEGKGLRIVIDLSTSGPRGAQALAEGLAAYGVATADSPVSGGVAGAESGKLSLMTACAPEVFDEIRPILECFGRVNHVGDRPGQAQLIKVINNLMSVTALAVASEGCVLAQKAGVDPAKLMEVVNSGSGRSNASEDKIPKYVLTRNFDFGFALALSAKDARLCLDEADALGVPMMVGSAARQLLLATKGQFGEDGDLTEMVRTIETWAGVQVRGGTIG